MLAWRCGTSSSSTATPPSNVEFLIFRSIGRPGLLHLLPLVEAPIKTCPADVFSPADFFLHPYKVYPRCCCSSLFNLLFSVQYIDPCYPACFRGPAYSHPWARYRGIVVGISCPVRPTRLASRRYATSIPTLPTQDIVLSSQENWPKLPPLSQLRYSKTHLFQNLKAP